MMHSVICNFESLSFHGKKGNSWKSAFQHIGARSRSLSIFERVKYFDIARS